MLVKLEPNIRTLATQRLVDVGTLLSVVVDESDASKAMDWVNNLLRMMKTSGHWNCIADECLAGMILRDAERTGTSHCATAERLLVTANAERAMARSRWVLGEDQTCL